MRDLVWSIWYPLAFWLLQFATTIVAYPLVLMRRRGKPATWVSPDRGLPVDRKQPPRAERSTASHPDLLFFFLRLDAMRH
jgi:biofilm PGA synthesis N-glycosyltransferase PgaC